MQCNKRLPQFSIAEGLSGIIIKTRVLVLMRVQERVCEEGRNAVEYWNVLEDDLVWKDFNY